MYDEEERAGMSKNNPMFDNEPEVVEPEVEEEEEEVTITAKPSSNVKSLRRMIVVGCVAVTTRATPDKDAAIKLNKKGVGCISKGSKVTFKSICEDDKWTEIITEEGIPAFVMSMYLEEV